MLLSYRSSLYVLILTPCQIYGLQISSPILYIAFCLNKFIYIFLAVLGLCCCTQAFSSCGEQGLLFVSVHGHLIAIASLVMSQALGMRASVVVARGFSSCGLWALECRLSSCGAQA